MKKIRVIVVEDQAMVLGALAALLDIEQDIAVVAMAKSGAEALIAIDLYRPDILVTDIEMPGMTGFALAAEARNRGPKIKIVMLTTFARPGYLRRILEAGASGYLLKDRPLRRI